MKKIIQLFAIVIICLALASCGGSSNNKQDGNSSKIGQNEVSSNSDIKITKEEILSSFIKDQDGNQYKIVTLGKQVWMAENLNVSHYRNGDEIPQVQDPSKWKYLTTGAWCYYENNSENERKYGKLYNWYAVNDSRGLSPEGWHIPSDQDWTELAMYLGGSELAGDRMKDSHEFNVAYGGFVFRTGEFAGLDVIGGWWSTLQNNHTIYCRAVNKNEKQLIRSSENSDFENGISVRCIKK